MKEKIVIRINAPKNKYRVLSEKFKSKENEFVDYWEYEMDYTPNSIYNAYKKLYKKFSLLKKLEITKDDISIWLFYEYVGQCNIELSPEEMGLLNKLGVSFCISCWEE